MVTITVDVRTHRLIEHAMRAFAPESISRLPSHFQVKIGDDRFSGADLTDAYNAVAAAPRSGVRAFLDLSTSHLQASTREMWTESFDAEHFPTPAWCGETGWLLFVPANKEAWDHVCGPELPAIFDHARATGAEYVRFDEGAPVIEALPIFEDAEEPEADAFWTAAIAAEAEPAAPFTFTPDDDAFIQAMSVQSFDATQIARLLGNRTGMPCSRTDVAVRLADLATAEALHG